jgi:UDP-N-acetylglucosamine 2-epimerase
MKRIVVAFGTRPEAIKLAPLVNALRELGGVEPLVCVTAQHRQMLDQILELFGITPDVDLDTMRPAQTLAGLSALILEKLSRELGKIQPDAVIVQGDTTTTLCSALAAFYARIPVGQVEAGLRTGDMAAPFPEEMNRVVTTRLARWHFAATEQNRQTLKQEGVPEENIFVTGNTVIDALLDVRARLTRGEQSEQTKKTLACFSRPYVLVTGHRRESFGKGLESICTAIRRFARRHPELDIVYPVHLNPRVQEPVQRILKSVSNVRLIEPQPYETFVGLMDRARFILTDSGGIQEEAPCLGKPVLVMRDKTERPEGLAGGVRLVGTKADRIVAECELLISDEAHYQRMAQAASPYGDGRASQRIARLLDQLLGGPAALSPLSAPAAWSDRPVQYT